MAVRAFWWPVLGWERLQLNRLKRVQIAILILAAIITPYTLGAHLVQALFVGMLGNAFFINWLLSREIDRTLMEHMYIICSALNSLQLMSICSIRILYKN